VPKLFVPALVIAAALVCGGAVLASANNYQVAVVMPNANNLFNGSSVMRDGFKAGSVKRVQVVDGKAKVTLDLDDSLGHLHDGARIQVMWKGVIGERIVTIHDGPSKNAEIPSGALLTDVAAEPVELSEVLSALDPATRGKVNTLIKRINATTSGHEDDMREALITSGPAVKQLGALLGDLGADGEAIKQILTQSNRTMEILSARQRTLGQVVGNLSDMSSSVVQERSELGQTLDKLPGVLDEGEKTFKVVPDAVDETVPLLEDLEPATDQLASTSKHLKPVLQDLRPAVHDLRPALGSLAVLLNRTPAMMDSGVATFPDLNKTIKGSQPAVKFLRPYTPELMGWLSNWGSAGANYDSNGHYARFHILSGAESVVPSVSAGLGVTQNLTPKPGDPVGQPWEDAYGDGLR
jgi:phospholipid/cholesterol/gamma-HCH transport system substrate-binding protein